MSDDTPSPLNNVITIDDERIKSHLDRVVRGTVEETLNALLKTRRKEGTMRKILLAATLFRSTKSTFPPTGRLAVKLRHQNGRAR
jgi:hypothetical protein